MVFFFTYVLFEVPANIMLKLLSPSTWISIMMVSWGIVMTLQGIVRSYHTLIVTRLMLGVWYALQSSVITPETLQLTFVQ